MELGNELLRPDIINCPLEERPHQKNSLIRSEVSEGRSPPPLSFLGRTPGKVSMWGENGPVRVIVRIRASSCTTWRGTPNLPDPGMR